MIGEVAALSAALAFGFSIILARRFMREVPPEAGVLVSIVTNVVTFAAISAILGLAGRLPQLTPLAVILFALGGLAGTLLGRNLSYQAINRIGASLSVTVRLTNSIFSLAIGFVVLRELPRAVQIAGITAVTIGLWLSLQPSHHEAGTSRSRRDLGGVVFALASAAAFALGDTLRRAGLQLAPAPVLGAAIGASTALALHLVWSVFNSDARWPSRATLRRFDVLGSAALNTVALLLLYTGLRHAPVAIVSVLYNLQVLVVLLAGPLILPDQERVTAWVAAGALVALVGTTLILTG
ncbi:MAG: DMT family transporter [Armatimonadota bacterium]|nr:DMT family transporter [Armatimonadota bacterium]